MNRFNLSTFEVGDMVLQGFQSLATAQQEAEVSAAQLVGDSQQTTMAHAGVTMLVQTPRTTRLQQEAHDAQLRVEDLRTTLDARLAKLRGRCALISPIDISAGMIVRWTDKPYELGTRIERRPIVGTLGKTTRDGTRFCLPIPCMPWLMDTTRTAYVAILDPETHEPVVDLAIA